MTNATEKKVSRYTITAQGQSFKVIATSKREAVKTFEAEMGELKIDRMIEVDVTRENLQVLHNPSGMLFNLADVTCVLGEEYSLETKFDLSEIHSVQILELSRGQSSALVVRGYGAKGHGFCIKTEEYQSMGLGSATSVTRLILSSLTGIERSLDGLCATSHRVEVAHKNEFPWRDQGRKMNPQGMIRLSGCPGFTLG